MEAFAHKADKSKVDIGSVLTAPNAAQNANEFYFDYQDGKYGFNTEPDRGADTFHPFGEVTINRQVRVQTKDTGSTSATLGITTTTKLNGNIWEDEYYTMQYSSSTGSGRYFYNMVQIYYNNAWYVKFIVDCKEVGTSIVHSAGTSLSWSFSTTKDYKFEPIET